MKLKEARLATGLSTRAVAAMLSSKYAVSHTTLANYESGKSSPPLDVIAVLASVYERPLNWFIEPGNSLTGIHYRNLPSKVRVQDRHRFEGAAKKLLEGYTRLERRLRVPLGRHLDVKGFEVKSGESGRQVAERLRAKLNLRDDQPIQSVVEILEMFAIRTIELRSELRIDGLAACLGDEHVVVLNPETSNDRCRLNAGHELGHVLFGDCQSISGLSEKEMEQRVFEFGSFLLLPRPQLELAFQGRSILRLLKFKEQFGIAMSAMIYRAEKEGILDKNAAKWLWIQFAKRGWRTKEPGYVWRDRAIRFELLLDSAAHGENRLTWREIEAVTSVPSEELKQRLADAIGAEVDDADDTEGGDAPRILSMR
ncbi:XRE family transcriptional regulator [Caulifigura coniformis]|uniref:XRE family transcriptional regulator n=1 Tax=Caulifigura coniformis TaxID=2527983 RepID=UPI0018D22300|nr:XRE family transcriptional regulator [Caulifigura coniformis]